MKHNKLIFTTIMVILLSTFVACSPATAATFTVEVYGKQYTYSDLPALDMEIEARESLMTSYHAAAELLRAEGVPEDNSAIIAAQQEYMKVYDEIKPYYDAVAQLNEHWEQKHEEYPEAAYVWKYLKSLGYSDYVCGGILGNMMAEVGGQTLNLQPYAVSYEGAYYGVCQWSKKYYPEVWGASLEEQCYFLANNIREQFNSYGSNYVKGFTFNDFMSIDSPKKAAKAFSKVYERNSDGTKQREKNAQVAYEYFIS